MESNLYPNEIVPSKEGFDLVFNMGVTSLVFFNGEKENPLVDVLRLATRKYKEYFILMVVDYTDENLDLDKAFYLKEFLGINHAPALRLIKIDEEI